MTDQLSLTPQKPIAPKTKYGNDVDAYNESDEEEEEQLILDPQRSYLSPVDESAYQSSSFIQPASEANYEEKLCSASEQSPSFPGIKILYI